MDPTVAIRFRDHLRDARALALKDAEAFDEVIFVIERLGVFLTGKLSDLGKYLEPVREVAARSPFADELPELLPAWHTSFATLYSLIKTGRNDALHQGAFARHLTAHAIDLSLILEDALVADVTCARDFMVPNAVCAELWEPISSIRRTMLMNAFSFLPVAQREDHATSWYLVSDFSLASYLRKAADEAERRKRLALPLSEAIAANEVELVAAPLVAPQDPIAAVLAASNGAPVLVVGPAPSYDLRGIVTPFDVL